MILVYSSSISLIISFLLNFKLVESDVIRIGRCPCVKVQQDFSNRLFSGLWFILHSNPMLLQKNTRCNKLEFQLKGVTYNIKNIFELENEERNPQNLMIINGTAYSNSSKEPSKLTMKYPIGFVDEANLVLPFWILYTDYQTAVAWSCTEYLSFLHTEYFWLLSRSKSVNDDTIQKLFGILNDFDINTSRNIRNDHDDCNQYRKSR